MARVLVARVRFYSRMLESMKQRIVWERTYSGSHERMPRGIINVGSIWRIAEVVSWGHRYGAAAIRTSP